MLNRQKKIKKWNTSILYGASSLCAFSSMVITAVNGGLSLDILSLSFGTGIVLWTGASMHGLYRAYVGQPETSTKLENATDKSTTLTVSHQWRPSTHATLNSTLHIGAAASLLLSDSIAISASPTFVLSTRIPGSALWLKGAFLAQRLARKQADHETNPESKVELCNVRQSRVYLTVELEYLLAAILYAIAIYSDNTTRTNPLKIIGNSCWILAGLYDTLHAVLKCCMEPNSEANEQLIQANSSTETHIQVDTENQSQQSLFTVRHN